MKIGFFGGSFNPPTMAHTHLAKLARERLNLDKIVFVPIGDFYSKKDLVPIDLRIKMLEIICEKENKKENKFEVSDIEKNFKEKKYAIDIFKIIEEEYKDHDFYFLMGADNFSKIPKWKDYDKLKNYKYIVFERNESIENIDLNKFKNVYLINTDFTKDISSTAIRNNVKNKNININKNNNKNNNKNKKTINLNVNEEKAENIFDKSLDEDVEKFIYNNKLYI